MTRPSIAAALVAAALAGVLAVQSGRHAGQHVRSLNDPHPALALAPPIILPASRRVARRVVLVILDGLRADTSRGLPALDALRARGVDAIAHSHFPTISSPNYVSLLAGVPPRDSGVRTNDYTGRVPLDNLFARARAAGLATTYVTHLSDIVPEFFPDIDDATLAPWPGKAVAATRAALARGDPLVVFLHNAPDEAGHAQGAASRAYREAAAHADRDLAKIVADLDLDRDAVIVTADHGHTDAGGHGGTESEVVEVPLVLAGAGIQPGAHIANAGLIDVAPTVAALLGISAPGHALGRVLVEALATPDRAVLARTDGQRHALLLPLLAELAAGRGAAAEGLRKVRGAVLAGAVLAVLLLLVWAWRRGAVILDPRVVVAGTLPVPLVFLTFAAVLGRLTPSAIAGQPTAVFAHALIAAGLAIAAHPLFTLAAFLGRPRRDRLRAAAGAALLGALVAILFAGGTWALGGDTLADTFFRPVDVIAPPLAQMAAAVQSGGTVVVLLVEGLIFWASGPRRRLPVAPPVPAVSGAR